MSALSPIEGIPFEVLCLLAQPVIKECAEPEKSVNNPMPLVAKPWSQACYHNMYLAQRNTDQKILAWMDKGNKVVQKASDGSYCLMDRVQLGDEEMALFILNSENQNAAAHAFFVFDIIKCQPGRDLKKLSDFLRYLKEYKYEKDFNVCGILLWAIYNGQQKVVQQALQDPSLTTNHLHWALYTSLKYRHVEIVKELLKDSRVAPGFKENEALFLGAIQDAAIQAFDGYKVECNYLGKILSWAACNGYREVVQQALKDPSLTTSDLHGALCGSCRKGYAEIVKDLLQDPRTDPTKENGALGAAVDHNHPHIVRLLMEDGRVNPADCDNHFLYIALAQNFDGVRQELVKDPRVVENYDTAQKKYIEYVHGRDYYGFY